MTEKDAGQESSAGNGGLPPVTRNPFGVLMLVSILVSASDPATQIPLLHTQVEFGGAGRN